MADPKAAKATKKTEGKKKLRLFIVKLTGKTPGSELKCVAKDNGGKYTTYVVHTLRNEEGKRVGGTGRGATAVHNSYEDAKAKANADADFAAKQGWTKKPRGSFGGPGADSFDLKSLPTA